MDKVKVYAALGSVKNYDYKKLSYYVGSYFVVMPTDSLHTMMANFFEAYITTKEKAVKIAQYTSKFVPESSMSSAEIVDQMESNNLLITGEGLSEDEAVLDLFEKCAFELRYPYPELAPRGDGLKYARKPAKLKGNEKKLYEILAQHFLKICDVLYKDIHGEEYEKHYFTLDDIMRQMKSKGCTPLETFKALRGLFEKRCIALYPKKPLLKTSEWGNDHIFFVGEWFDE